MKKYIVIFTIFILAYFGNFFYQNTNDKFIKSNISLMFPVVHRGQSFSPENFINYFYLILEQKKLKKDICLKYFELS